MIATYARSQYQEMQVQTTPERLVIMLYDGAIGFVERGREALRRGDLDTQAYCLKKAQDILCHLLSTLNWDAGPIATQLQAIYRYCLERVLAGHAQDDTAALEEVVLLLSDLRESWVSAEKAIHSDRGTPILAKNGATA